MATYAFSDLHGMYPLWTQIKNFIKPEDTVYCLGDCADRGPDGLKIIQEVLNTPNITYIRGNHEQFIIDEDKWLWTYNGGAQTIEDWEALPDKERKRLKDKLKETSFIENYVNESGLTIALCHAGFDPELMKHWDDYELLWNRSHIKFEWPQAEWYFLRVVHGHTPIQYIHEFIPLEEPKVNPQAYWYAKGHKCCIDQGSFISGKVLLLNLDTFEEIVFEMKMEEN